MLPPLQAPSSHTSRPPCCPHLSSLHSGQREPFPCKSESCLSSEETPKVSLLTRSTSTPTSTRGQASPTKGLLRFHLTLLSTAHCYSHMGPSCLRNCEWAGPLPGMPSPHRATWLRLSFPKGPYSKVTFSEIPSLLFPYETANSLSTQLLSSLGLLYFFFL